MTTLKPFDEQDEEALRTLGFTISVTRDGEFAMVKGVMTVGVNLTINERLVLAITLPNGREIAALISRETLRDAGEIGDIDRMDTARKVSRHS